MKTQGEWSRKPESPRFDVRITVGREAIALMRRHEADCLPVVSDGALAGVSERDFIHLASDGLAG